LFNVLVHVYCSQKHVAKCNCTGELTNADRSSVEEILVFQEMCSGFRASLYTPYFASLLHPSI